MTSITINEIQHDLLGWLQRVKAGETLVILEENTPVAEIKPVATNGESLRPYGLCAGQFEVPDNFNDPLPNELVKLFEGG
jgi:antitoxin (DNA-binding transcriptional repressor) of toxin-antitoxin stability system